MAHHSTKQSVLFKNLSKKPVIAGANAYFYPVCPNRIKESIQLVLQLERAREKKRDKTLPLGKWLESLGP